MIEFIIEFVWWIKSRAYRKRLQGRPYFWGPPDSKQAYLRYQTFLYCCGLFSLPPEESET
jgi:hypothetical protein